MKVRLSVSGIVLAVALTGLLACSGCTYLQNRGNDLSDVLDVGITVSKDPTFSAYIGFLNMLSLGYSNFDGTLLGLADRHFGATPARQHTYGLLFAGREQFGYGEAFKADDPNSPTPWGAAIAGRGERPPQRQIVNCPKLLHLGWIGITINCKFGELADFLLGWFGPDIMGDDAKGAAGEKAPEPPPAPRSS